MDDSEARVPRARPPLSSITREVSTSELAPLVDATRPADELDTAALGGAEIDELLAPERTTLAGPVRGGAEKAEPPVLPPPLAPPPPSARAAPAPPSARAAPAPPSARAAQAPPSARTAQAPPSARTAPAPPSARATPAVPAPSQFAGVSVPPTEVPVAASPLMPLVPEPSVVLAPGLSAAHAQPLAPPVPEPFAAPPASVPQGPVQARPAPPERSAEPSDWAERTALPVSRAAVRSARSSGTLIVAVVAGVVVFGGLLAVLLWKMSGDPDRGEDSRARDSSGGTGNSASPPVNPLRGTGTSASGTADTPRGTSDTPRGTSDTPRGTGTSASGTADAPSGTPAAEARAALERLRQGIGTCVRKVIGVLPGTSPAVPSGFEMFKQGVYKSLSRDFNSPVFTCAKYRESEPQRFLIQWQLTTQPSEGRGVVWLDDDGDGRPDRAFSFRAALTRKNEVDLGEIGQLTPVPAILRTKK